MPQNQQTLEALRQAMVLAEQTSKDAAAYTTVSSVSAEESLRDEIQCLRNQLSEILAFQQMHVSSQIPQQRYERQPQQPQRFRPQSSRERPCSNQWQIGSADIAEVSVSTIDKTVQQQTKFVVFVQNVAIIV